MQTQDAIFEQEQARLAQSQFLARWVHKHPQEWAELKTTTLLTQSQRYPLEPTPTSDVEQIGRALREYRNRQMAIIAWRDLAGVDDLNQTLSWLSQLAERCIQTALDYAEQSVVERHGWLQDRHGEPIRLIVIAMGKLGGYELNFSSDVDLIFSYAQSGESNGQRPLDAESWLTRVARRLVQLLNKVTEAGFVFRVDTRLRPFGQSGALVLKASAMQRYYLKHGREWERYAWVKARAVAGDLDGGATLIKQLRPFVYRHYLDYGAFDSIREMKALLDQQVARAELQDNIKLGSGGIREVEFIVQAFQLVRGGHEPKLQNNQLQAALDALAAAGYLDAETAQTLLSCYQFLRRTENRLQMWADQQTHDLPKFAVPQQALAQAMGFASWEEFLPALDTVREQVHAVYAQVFVSPQAEIAIDDSRQQLLREFWRGKLDVQASQELLANYGLHKVEPITQAIARLRKQNLYGKKNRGQRWLMDLVPSLFAAAATTEHPDQALLRALTVLDAIIGRSTYVAMLLEYPKVLTTLMRLCAASPWISNQIARQPALLDTLLDLDQLYRPARRAEMEAALAAEFAEAGDDDEQQMDSLRQFTQREMLRIAAADVSDAIPLMRVSDHLTDLAEVVLAAAVDLAWAQMQGRYGLPRQPDGQAAHFCVVGYGKLGGIELGYGSDLDLVFLHDSEAGGRTDGQDDGQRVLDNQAFFIRLAQRLVHILSLRTPAGRAYEVDVRLRPSGRAGLLVIPVNAFADYQRERAWTWEHQALVRARAVAGSPSLCQRFEAIRREVLAQPRDDAQLVEDVCTMRERMRGNLDHSKDELLDLKQAPGGLVDIEFLAQLMTLRHGHHCPELLIYSDTIRLLETLESARIASYPAVKELTAAYRSYRRYMHKQALQEQRAMIVADALVAQRDHVCALWKQWVVPQK